MSVTRSTFVEAMLGEGFEVEEGEIDLAELDGLTWVELGVPVAFTVLSDGDEVCHSFAECAWKAKCATFCTDGWVLIVGPFNLYDLGIEGASASAARPKRRPGLDLSKLDELEWIEYDDPASFAVLDDDGEEAEEVEFDLSGLARGTTYMADGHILIEAPFTLGDLGIEGEN